MQNLQYKFFGLPKNLYNLEFFTIQQKILLNNKSPKNTSIIKIGDIIQVDSSFLIEQKKKHFLCFLLFSFFII